MSHPAARRSRFRLVALALVAGCAASRGLAPDASVSVRPTPAGVAISNAGERRIFYAVVPTRSLPLLDLYFCVDAASCRSVAAGAAVVVPWPDPPGGERDYRVFWWGAARDRTGAARADSVRTVDVTR